MSDTTTKPITPRYNAAMTWEQFIPKRTDGRCACGCERPARRRWATDECHKPLLTRFLILKGDNGTIRKEVFKRDRGICAACGLDTEHVRSLCALWVWEGDFKTPELYQEAKAAIDELRQRYRLRGFPAAGSTWWQADHILEVVRGGGGCDLDGYQTLCVPCHSAKTARLAGELAAERRSRKQEAWRPARRVEANLP